MRNVIAAEFMTIDVIIQSSPEDGFKFERVVFRIYGRGIRGSDTEAAGERGGSAVGA